MRAILQSHVSADQFHRLLKSLPSDQLPLPCLQRPRSKLARRIGTAAHVNRCFAQSTFSVLSVKP